MVARTRHRSRTRRPARGSWWSSWPWWPWRRASSRWRCAGAGPTSGGASAQCSRSAAASVRRVFSPSGMKPCSSLRFALGMPVHPVARARCCSRPCLPLHQPPPTCHLVLFFRCCARVRPLTRFLAPPPHPPSSLPSSLPTVLPVFSMLFSPFPFPVSLSVAVRRRRRHEWRVRHLRQRDVAAARRCGRRARQEAP